MRIQKLLWPLALALLLHISTASGLDVVRPIENATHFDTPVLPQFGLPDFAPWHGLLITEREWDDANSLYYHSDEVCVLHHFEGDGDISTRVLYNRGARCMVNVGNFGDVATGISAYFRESSTNVSFVQVPVVEIAKINADFLESLMNKTRVWVVINSTDPNEYDYMAKSPLSIVFSVILGGIAAGLMVASLVKLTFHVRAHGVVMSVAQVFFAIEIVSNFLRVWFAVVSYRWGVLFMFTTISSSLSWPLTLISTLLICTKWQELTNFTSVRVSMFLSDKRAFFLAASAIIFMIELISASLRPYLSVVILSSVSWALLAIISIVITVMLWVAGIRILRQLASSQQATSTQDKNVAQMIWSTRGIMLSGVFLLGAVVWLVIGAILPISSASTATAMAFSGILIIMFASLCQQASFPVISRSKKNSDGNSRTGSLA